MEDADKGDVPMAVNLRMAYQSGDGVVAEDRHVRASAPLAVVSSAVAVAEVRRGEGPFLIRMRVAEVNAERSRSFVIE